MALIKQGLPGLRFARFRKRLSREALAREAGVTYQMIYNLEEGVRDASQTLLTKLADILDTTTDALLGRAPKRAA